MSIKSHVVSLEVGVNIRVVNVDATDPLAAAIAAHDRVKDQLSDLLKQMFAHDDSQPCFVESITWSGREIEAATVQLTLENGQPETYDFEMEYGTFHRT